MIGSERYKKLDHFIPKDGVVPVDTEIKKVAISKRVNENSLLLTFGPPTEPGSLVYSDEWWFRDLETGKYYVIHAYKKKWRILGSEGVTDQNAKTFYIYLLKKISAFKKIRVAAPRNKRKVFTRDQAFDYAKKNFAAPPGWKFTSNGLVKRNHRN